MTMHAMNAYIGSKEDLKREGFIYEPKLDGFRALCHVSEKGFKLISRGGQDLTDRFIGMDFRKNIKAKTAILDGEIVALNKKGVPDFGLLHKGHRAVFIVFDILMKDRKVFTDLPLLERKKILEKTVNDGNGIEKIVFTYDGVKLFKAAKKAKFEGVMAKDAQSIYYPGKRKKVWLKVKFLQTIDCVIVGYTSGIRTISSLCLGLYDGQKRLRFIGKVGTGFTQEYLQELEEKFSKIITKKKPVVEDFENVTWLKPKYVCEVALLEFHPQYIRHPSFYRMRTDKKPQQCTIAAQIPKKLIPKIFPDL